MKTFPTLALAGLSILAATAVAAPNSNRIRGSIQSFDQNSATIQTRKGQTTKVMLNDNTKYVWVVQSSLSKIGQGDYIGTATKQQNGRLVALEVSIFPPSMSGMGEGHYSWDKLRDTTGSGGMVTSSGMTNGKVAGASMSGSSMTNGSVTGTSMTGSSMTNGTVSGGSGSMMTQSSMTNGTVSRESMGGSTTQSAMTNGNVHAANGQMGGKQITVTYNGKQKQVFVPPSAPVVAFKPASHSALKQGAQVFIIAKQNNGQWTANLVAVGKNGLNPPM